jgi:uncharacterized protein (TIGR00369 family)
MPKLEGEMQLPPDEGCFVCGTANDGRIDTAYYWHQESGVLRAEIVLGIKAKGPPGHVHGGALAAVLDELMGTAAWLSGHTVLAGNINVNFRHMAPLERHYDATAQIDRVDGRKVFARGEMRNEEGTVVADSTGLFIMIDPAKIGLGDPEAYKQRREAYMARMRGWG